MVQKEVPFVDLFAEIQSSFKSANKKEKRRLAHQILDWAGQQVDDLGIQPSHRKTHPQVIQNEITNASEIPGLVVHNTHLKQILTNIEQVIWLEDALTEKIFYISPAFEKVWGRPINSMYDHTATLLDSVHPEDRVQVLVAKPLINHEPINQVFRIVRPDGEIRWINNRIFYIDDSTRKPFCLVRIALDITDQKNIETTLRKTLDRSREQFDLSHKMSLVRKPEVVLKTLMAAREFQTAHRAALLFFDDENLGPEHGAETLAVWQSSQTLKSWSNDASLYEDPGYLSIFQPNQVVIISDIHKDPRLTVPMRKTLQDGQIEMVAIFPMIALGKWLGSLLVYYPKALSFDHIEMRHLKILIDQTTITLFNLKLLEVEEESRHEAERANEIKTEFLAMISHELRTPLTSIMGFTNTLLADDVSWGPTEQHDFILTIHQETLRLQELIDHLLDLSRLEAGMLPITFEPHTVYEIIEEAESQIKMLTNEHILHVNLPENMPVMSVDVKRIAQVIVNLVKNASIYTPKGTVIGISAGSHGGFVQINVSDQGPGIPQNEYKRVFKAFKRGVSAEKQYIQGAGLGLAICKGLVEAHGGRIWIKRKTDIGATICFTLKINPLNETEILSEMG